MCASRIRTRFCPVRVRNFVHWATAARPIDFMLCSVFISSWQRIIPVDSAFEFTKYLLYSCNAVVNVRVKAREILELQKEIQTFKNEKLLMAANNQKLIEQTEKMTTEKIQQLEYVVEQ